MPAEYESDATTRTKQGIERAKEKAVEVTREAKQRGKQRAEEGKDAASDKLQTLAGAVEDVAARLGEHDETLAGFASTLAQQATRLAENLRSKSIDDLAREARGLARRNPSLFFAGSVIAGIVLARLLKVSTHHAEMAPSFDAPLDSPIQQGSDLTGQYVASGEGSDFNRTTGY